jgi:hypothetical protein
VDNQQNQAPGAGQPGANVLPAAKAKAADKAKGKAAGGLPLGAQIVEENGKFYRVFGGSPYYNMKDGCDQWIFGLMMDDKVGATAIEMLDKYKDKPFFFFVHFAEVDHMGHQHGENSKEYNDAIISGDKWLGKIVAKLREQGLYDKTLIYVTADHGFNEGEKGHSYAPWVFLATTDKTVNRNGCREDIAPTILKRFGVNLASLNPKLDGYPLDEPAPERKAPAEKPAAPGGAKGGKKGETAVKATGAKGKPASAPSDSGAGAKAGKSGKGRAKGAPGAK